MRRIRLPCVDPFGGPALAVPAGPRRGRRPALRSAAAATVAVAAFVVVSVVLAGIVDAARRAVGLAADDLLQTLDYCLVTSVAMALARRVTDLIFGVYRRAWVVYTFVGIELILIASTAGSRRIEVDYLASICRMAVLCGSAYLQFRPRPGARGGPGVAHARD